MAKAELGDKQLCPNCGAKFYDLRRRPATCPKCATSFDPVEEGVKVRRGRAKVSNYKAGYQEEEEEAEEKEAVAGDEEEEVEETPEIDAEAVDEVATLEEGEEAEASPDALPPGFSEEEADLEEEGSDDDVPPLLEDEEEFPEDEIGEIAADEDEGEGR
ncbi:MAG: TIGR02300 family protein [Pseudomonadota bacterium]